MSRLYVSLARVAIPLLLAVDSTIVLNVWRAQAACNAFMQVYGQDFVHGGDHRRSAPPPYLDPFDLLDAPTVDPTIPFRRDAPK